MPSALRADFLKAAQSGNLQSLQSLHQQDSMLLHGAQSTSKGYTALHFAAMAGELGTVEWLIQQGVHPDVPDGLGKGVTPLQLALEYKRLQVARRLQQLRGSTGAKVAPKSDAGISDGAVSGLDRTSRPAPRFPPWILAGRADGGLDVPVLEGATAEAEAEAARLTALSAPFVWRGAGLCPAFPQALKQLDALSSQTLDTNVARREDRKFVYFSPDRLEKGVYDPAPIRRQFAPMRLNEPRTLGDTLRRQRAQALGDVERQKAREADDDAATAEAAVVVVGAVAVEAKTMAREAEAAADSSADEDGLSLENNEPDGTVRKGAASSRAGNTDDDDGPDLSLESNEETGSARTAAVSAAVSATAGAGAAGAAGASALRPPGQYARKAVVVAGAEDSDDDEEEKARAETKAAAAAAAASGGGGTRDGDGGHDGVRRDVMAKPTAGAIIGTAVDVGGWLQSKDVGGDEKGDGGGAGGATYVMHKLLECASAKEAGMLASRGHTLPPHLRPGIARLRGLSGEQYALWMSTLHPIAQPTAELTAWSRVGALASAGGWGDFEQAGLMVSGRDALTPTHYDGHHNIFLQLCGAKRFLLFPAEQGPMLYGFPALHPLDPLSRVDLELPEHELAARWPRTREAARGACVTLEAGDALVMPQGVWHQVHSLDARNVSINLLFALPATEKARPGAGGDNKSAVPMPQGMAPPPVVSRVPAHRRTAALLELAKSVEAIVASAVGPANTAAALAAAAGAADDGGIAASGAREVVHELLGRCLGPAQPGAGGPVLPTVEQFVRSYFDPRRFEGLPLRSGLRR